jgi:hypothetical protein
VAARDGPHRRHHPGRRGKDLPPHARLLKPWIRGSFLGVELDCQTGIAVIFN